MTRQFATIDEYISAFPVDVQPRQKQVRQTGWNVAPGARETISYAMPTLTLNDRDLMHFAAWKRYISLYPLPAEEGAFTQEFARYREAKGTVIFPPRKPIPYDLIERLVTLRVKQRLAAERDRPRGSGSIQSDAASLTVALTSDVERKGTK